MKFDLSNHLEVSKARTRFDFLVDQGAKIDLIKISPKRTNPQNNYIHVLFSLFGAYIGLTLEESKSFLKRACPFGTYEKMGERFEIKTSEMDTMEFTIFIDWIRNYSSNQGCYLPTPDEFRERQFYFEQEIESVKQYL